MLTFNTTRQEFGYDTPNWPISGMEIGLMVVALCEVGRLALD